jgi:prefoldin subunit 5
MKKFLPILIVGMIITGSLKAQIHLFLEEQEVTVPDGKITAWVFPTAGNLEETLDDLKNYCKDRSDLKMKKEGENIIMAEKISFPAVATKRGDLIGYSFMTEKYYAMALAFKLGYDISVDSESWAVEAENLRNYAKAFMTYHYEQTYARRVEILEKEIKGLEKDKKQNENKIGNITDKVNSLGKKIGKETDTAKIDSYQAEINTLEADMRQLMDTLPGLESQLADLRKQVDQNKTESYTYLGAIGAF